MTNPAGVVSLEPGQYMILPYILPVRHWHQLREDLNLENAVAMKLSYAFCRHLMAIVEDARLMLEFNQYVVVHLRISQFDDGL